MKLKVPEILRMTTLRVSYVSQEVGTTLEHLQLWTHPRGIPSEKLPCPIGYVRKTAVAAATGAENATKIQGRIPSR
jgi:hypothetical protein